MTQPRPCQPIWVTLPFSISTGTVSCPPVAASMRIKASVILLDIVFDVIAILPFEPLAHFSAYTGSRRCRRVQVMHAPAPGFAKDVVDGSLHFLDARNVIGADDEGIIGQAAADDFAAVVTEQCDGQQACACGLPPAP